ncbi:MAG: hypothetical protein ACTSVV_02780 [Promethearchaeota archaeon]
MEIKKRDNYVNKQNGEEDDVEKLLDIIWENWSSRRACEKTHLPEYIKKMKKEGQSRFYD